MQVNGDTKQTTDYAMFREQVSTISKRAADGRTVSTRVIQGPTRGKKRMMRVMRDTVNGPELVAEIEVPANCSDVNAFLETLPSLGRQRHGVARKDSAGHYDNVHDDRLTSSDANDVIRRQPNGGTNIAKVSPCTLTASSTSFGFCVV